MSILKIKNQQGIWEEVPTINGKDAKINGVNTINMVAGENITLDQQDNTLTISAIGSNVDDVQLNGTSILQNKVANILAATDISDTPTDGKLVTEKTLYDYVASGNDGKTRKLDNIDLNTITNTGFYSCNVCTNRPTANNGVMLVLKNGFSSDNLVQVYWTFAADVMWVRHKDLGNWKQWKAVLKTGEESVTDVQVNGTSIVQNQVANVDLTDYVKNTDWASSSKGGVIRTPNWYNAVTDNSGNLYCLSTSYETYLSKDNVAFMSKGTLENVITGKQLLSATDVENNVVSTDTDKPLSANMGKELNDRIQNLASIGKYLAMWDCTTGLPTTNPVTMPYNYTTGDYYVISNISTTNYMPNGSTYNGTASTTVYSGTETLTVGDFFYYDGTVWSLMKNTGKTVAFANIAGNPMDNSNLASVLNDKVGFTDYATSSKGGTIKIAQSYNTEIDPSGYLGCAVNDYGTYQSRANPIFISKGTLENVIAGKELENKVNDVQINGTSILSNKIADIPVGTNNAFGVFKTSGSYGVKNVNGILEVQSASNGGIDSRSSNYFPIVPANLDYAVRSVRPKVITTAPGLVEVNAIYPLGERTSLAIQLPSGQVGDFFEIQFISKTTPTTLTITSSYGMTYLDLTPEANTIYNIYGEWQLLDSNTYGWFLTYVEAPISSVGV